MSHLLDQPDAMFTEAGYRHIIHALIEAGYTFVGYEQLDPSRDGQVVLRHDVDFSLEDAVRLAEIEHELGVTSAYHLLLTMETYNPLSPTGQAILQRIRQLGHRIGLHLDPLAIADGDTTSKPFAEGLRRLMQVAAVSLGELDSYSVHRPATNGKMEDLRPERLATIHTMPTYADSDRYRKDILFRSDSRRQWRRGCFDSEIPSLHRQSLQLVTHPIWWTPTPCSREEVLQSYIARQQQLTDVHLANNLSFYEARTAEVTLRQS